jgi:hypothetical protein
MDDAPRNVLMYYTVSATSQQALAALVLTRIAKAAGRPDLVDFFESEHTALGKIVNEHFWDKEHRLYNDLNREGLLITELQPGSLCKHGFMFWPLIAKIADCQGRNLFPHSLCVGSGRYGACFLCAIAFEVRGIDKRNAESRARAENLE